MLFWCYRTAGRRVAGQGSLYGVGAGWCQGRLVHRRCWGRLRVRLSRMSVHYVHAQQRVLWCQSKKWPSWLHPSQHGRRDEDGKMRRPHERLSTGARAAALVGRQGLSCGSSCGGRRCWAASIAASSSAAASASVAAATASLAAWRWDCLAGVYGGAAPALMTPASRSRCAAPCSSSAPSSSVGAWHYLPLPHPLWQKGSLSCPRDVLGCR